MQFFSRLFFVLTLLVAGCTGEALTTFNGNHGGLDGDVVCKTNADCNDGYVCNTKAGECVAKQAPAFDCRVKDNDCNDGYVCNDNTGKCDPKVTVCTPECDGKTCGNDGCGGSCGTCDAGETCAVSGVCKTPTSTSCAEVGCKDNYTCNISTGKCELKASKAGKCYIRTANGSDFIVNGGGVNKLSDALSGWSTVPIYSVDGVAVVPIGTAKYLSFNAASDSNWGAGGKSQFLYGYYTSAADFRIATDIYVECMSTAGTWVNAEFVAGPQAPTASESTVAESLVGETDAFVSNKDANKSRLTHRVN